MPHTMLTNSEIRYEVKKVLIGRYFTFIGMFLLIAIVSGLLNQLLSVICGNATSSFSEIIKAWSNGQGSSVTPNMYIFAALSWIFSLLFAPAYVGVSFFALQINREAKVQAPFDLFLRPYKSVKLALKVILVLLLKNILITIGFILFIIPGLIMILNYSLTSFVLMDEPDLKATEVIRRSKELMKGYKGRYSFLILSYFAWLLILSILLFVLVICGLSAVAVTIFFIALIPSIIAMSLLAPKLLTATAKFYDEIRLTISGDPIPMDAGSAPQEEVKEQTPVFDDNNQKPSSPEIQEPVRNLTDSEPFFDFFSKTDKPE